MTHRRQSDEWRHKLNQSQRNTVFPDTARNFGRFWGGIYKQKLNTVQSVGLVILVLFYLAFFVALVAMSWPRRHVSFWSTLFYGYGPDVLLFLPLVFFFLVLHWRIRPRK